MNAGSVNAAQASEVPESHVLGPATEEDRRRMVAFFDEQKARNPHYCESWVNIAKLLNIQLVRR